MMLSLDTAYRSFGGEVEASSTPTICRLPDSRRHQLWAIAPCACRAICVGHYRVAGCAHSDPLEISRVKAAESLAGREVRESELGASWIFGLRSARYSFKPSCRRSARSQSPIFGRTTNKWFVACCIGVAWS